MICADHILQKLRTVANVMGHMQYVLPAGPTPMLKFRNKNVALCTNVKLTSAGCRKGLRGSSINRTELIYEKTQRYVFNTFQLIKFSSEVQVFSWPQALILMICYFSYHLCLDGILLGDNVLQCNEVVRGRQTGAYGCKTPQPCQFFRFNGSIYSSLSVSFFSSVILEMRLKELN